MDEPDMIETKHGELMAGVLLAASLACVYLVLFVAPTHPNNLKQFCEASWDWLKDEKCVHNDSCLYDRDPEAGRIWCKEHYLEYGWDGKRRLNGT